jgi:UDP-N-acetylmuramoylalanine--D-glutamate ligase
MAALGVAHVLGVPFEKALVGLRRYHLMAHRCEAVGQVNGVAYINDSKATNLDALAKALDSQTAPVVLIAGGKDKGFDFNSLSELVARKTRKAILIGEMAERIREGWAAVTDCVVVDSLQQAVEAAHQTSVPGEVVLFSPGTSSFDMFKNYADRGNQFRDLVHELSRVPGPRRTQSGRSAAGNPSGTS